MAKSGGRWRRDGEKERRWRGLLQEQRLSGESIRAFCRKRKLHETSLYYWRREIELRDREVEREGPPSLAPVVVIDEPTIDSAAPIEIVLGDGTTIRVPPGCASERLAMVLDVLGSARC